MCSVRLTEAVFQTGPAKFFRKSKKGIDERGHRTSLGKKDQEPQEREHEHDREQPITFPHLQELPKFNYQPLISHIQAPFGGSGLMNSQSERINAAVVVAG
jgi:hypothetical protein